MLELNSQCNLRCGSCTRDSLAKEGLRSPKHMSREELIDILEQLKPCPIDTIKIEGLSEPMLFSGFAQHTKLIRSYFPKAHIIVITNLQYNAGDSPLIESLNEIDAIYLSIDGTESTYEKLRPPGKYSRFIKNLEFLHKNLDSNIMSRKVYLNFTASEVNYQELPKIYELKSQFNLAGVRINLIQNWSPSEAGKNYYSSELLEFLKDFRSDLKGVPSWQFNQCFWPYNGLVIDVEGNLRQCVLNTTQKPFGNAIRSDLMTQYNNSLVLNEARDLLQSNKAPTQCKNCDYKFLGLPLAKVFENYHSAPTSRKILK